MRTTNLEYIPRLEAFPEPEVHAMFRYSLKRERVSEVSEPISTSSPKAVADFCRAIGLHDEEQEHFIVILLDVKQNVRGYVLIAMGALDQCPIHIREIFRSSIIYGASAIIIVHNHPSGNPEPSVPDMSLTKTAVVTGMIIGVEVTDHVIIAGDKHFSFLEKNMLPKFTIKESLEIMI